MRVHTYVITHLFLSDCSKCLGQNFTLDYLFSNAGIEHLRLQYQSVMAELQFSKIESIEFLSF